MKLLVAFAVLSATVLAVPTEVARADNPPFFELDSFACACTNAAGEPATWSCPYGDLLSDAGELSNFCYIADRFARPLEQIMDANWCARFPGYPTPVCKPVKLCLAFPQCTNYPDKFSPCGHPQDIMCLFCATRPEYEGVGCIE